jgi:hypothetical protein
LLAHFRQLWIRQSSQSAASRGAQGVRALVGESTCRQAR